MDTVVSITEHADFLDRLGSALPEAIDRFEGVERTGDASAAPPVVLRFAYRDVPFVGRIERSGTAALLRLTGAIGPLPFSAQAPRRRHRALSTLAAAGRTPLKWRVSARQEISVEGMIALPRPLRPATMVAGAVQLLLQADGHLSLLLDVLGGTASLDSPPALAS